MDKIKLFYYFYKEKDEIRNRNVTGVETCALRICEMVTEAFMTTKTQARETLSVSINSLGKLCKKRIATQPYLQGVERIEIGRASCRERVKWVEERRVSSKREWNVGEEHVQSMY